METPWATRPDSEYICAYLENYFPHHELDKATVSRATEVAGVSKKTWTKLWGSELEEVMARREQMIQNRVHPPEHNAGGPTTFAWIRGEMIGRGTYGRVYVALNTTVGDMMAVKIIDVGPQDPEKSGQKVAQRLKTKSKTLEILDHPNIAQYLGFKETPESFSLFSEYVPGGSLGSLISKYGELSEENARYFASQILTGLVYLHRNNILHGLTFRLESESVQYSPLNVRHLQGKISDFGVPPQSAKGMQANIFWMAPELVDIEGMGYSLKADIWSIGCILLEMLSGFQPWVGHPHTIVLRNLQLAQQRAPPPVPEGVVLSELADNFRQKCFVIDPEQRPSASEVRKHGWLELPRDWQFQEFS